MKTKQIVIGLAIFTIVTIILFLLARQLFSVSEPVSVVLAIAGGLVAEILYRKKKLGQ
ncbi:hypothetical protein H1D32_23585 [Anaerobacillus sp. CMMVII]|uniref:hypothetical protein n=1 Tax=Anaerobacillus sp. CMMVII TaxID=2755588 RepID=UPI0021B76ABE|nr:hypothetical protein [Anaerobacillus sp. CMMVII]MCT8140415.1 hypothetical protein [Anaerobacillus sp. CMMVII]